MPLDTTDRHPTVQSIARWFDYEHLVDRAPHLAEISGEVYALAETMLAELPDDTMLVLGLQHLLEAKDCFVRAAEARHQAEVVNQADLAHEARKEAIVDHEARLGRMGPENPTGVKVEPSYLDALSREPRGHA